MLLIRSVAVIRMVPRIICVARSSWRANSSPGARETCGGARGRVLNARSAKLDLHFSIKDLSQDVLESSHAGEQT